MKHKLICVGQTSFTGQSPHHLPILDKHFTLENYDAERTYSKSDTFFYREKFEGIERLLDTGCKMIKDELWEQGYQNTSTLDSQQSVACCVGDSQNFIRVPKWFWYEEHQSQREQKPNEIIFKHKESKFLMQIGLSNKRRRRLYEELLQQNLLQDSLYSFLEKGISLEGPIVYNPQHKPINQRAYNKEWYERTFCTVAVECSYLEGHGAIDAFITEKTFKPIMYGHPFVVYGDANTLSTLRTWGFSTFDNLFDETYDSMSSYEEKVKDITRQLKNLKCHYDPETKEKIRYNFARFWNSELVEQGMVKELINPIKEFISKT